MNRIAYSELYAVIGTTFGSSSDTTFKIPDCRGKVAGAAGQGSGLTNRTIGETTGSETRTLTVDQLPSHTHTGTTDGSGTHTHTTNATGGSLGLISSNGNNTASSGLDSTAGEPNLYAPIYALSVNDSGYHTHTFTTNAAGENNAFSIMQPTIFLGNVFIYSGVLEPNEPSVYTQGKDDNEYGN